MSNIIWNYSYIFHEFHGLYSHLFNLIPKVLVKSVKVLVYSKYTLSLMQIYLIDFHLLFNLNLIPLLMSFQFLPNALSFYQSLEGSKFVFHYLTKSFTSHNVYSIPDTLSYTNVILRFLGMLKVNVN